VVAQVQDWPAVVRQGQAQQVEEPLEQVQDWPVVVRQGQAQRVGELDLLEVVLVWLTLAQPERAAQVAQKAREVGVQVASSQAELSVG